MNRRATFSAFLLVFLAATLPLRAGVHIWTGAASDRFSDPLNWRGGSPAGDPAAELSFPAGAVRVAVTNDLSSLTIRSLAISGSGYSIGGLTIGLATGAEVIDSSGGPNTIQCNLLLTGAATFLTGTNLGGLTVSGVISGTGPVFKVGPGQAAFTGSQPNTYSGGTQILNGRLFLGKNDGVNAVPGDLVIGTTGVNSEQGQLLTLASEQIPDSATIRVGGTSTLEIGFVETVGPLVLEAGASIDTTINLAFTPLPSGMLILGGDLTVQRGSANSVSNAVAISGDLALSGVRTVTRNSKECESCSLSLNNVRDHRPGTGLIVRDAWVAVNGSYHGPTVLEGGSLTINNSNTAVHVRSGSVSATTTSLIVDEGDVGSAVINGFDLRLSPLTTAHVRVNPCCSPLAWVGRGTFDLANAKLELTDLPERVLGKTYLVARNDGSGPIRRGFDQAPEGAILRNRFRISYAGGDGNDITLTEVGRYYTRIQLSASETFIGVGETVSLNAWVFAEGDAGVVPPDTVTFREGSTVIAQVPVDALGRASATVQPAWGTHIYTVTYSGTAELAPSEETVRVDVRPPVPTITSIDPASVQGGTKASIVIRGTNFMPGGNISVSGYGYLGLTYVSPTELRYDWDVPRYETDTTGSLVFEQPQPGSVRSNEVSVLVKGSPTPGTALTFEQGAVVGRVAAGGGAAWLNVGRVLGALADRFGTTRDSDRDGIVRWQPVNGLTEQGMFLMTDMIDGSITVGTHLRKAPAAAPFPRAMFLRDPNGNYSHMIYTSFGPFPGVDLLWVRPGVGAWTFNPFDGGGRDLDGAGNGIVVNHVSQMVPVNDSPAVPAGFEPGDVLVGISFYSFDRWIGDRVADHLSESDGPGVIRWVEDTVSIGEATPFAAVKVLRTGGTDGEISVGYTTVNDTAMAGLDYVARAGRLTFGPGEILKTIEIPRIDDSTHSGGPTIFKVLLSDPAGTTIHGDPVMKVVLSENDPAPQLSIDSVTIAEGDEGEHEAKLTVTLTGATRATVVVEWNGHRTLTFAPGGPRSQEIAIPFEGDRIANENRVYAANLVVVKGGALPERLQGKVTVIDDDVPELVILDATVSESKDKVTLLVSPTAPSDKPVTVKYATANGSATSGSDFTTTTGTLTFNRTSGSLLVSIPLLADSEAEGDEWFSLVLSDPTNARIRRGAATIVIVDDESAAVPAISGTPLVVVEGPNVNVTFSLSFPSIREVRFRAATVPGSATAEDFGPVDKEIVFPIGATTASLAMTIPYDSRVEKTESFSIVLSDPVGAIIATPIITATILDTDQLREPAAVRIAAAVADLVEGNAGTTVARFTISLSSASTSVITALWATADGTAEAPADYIAASGSLTFAPGETTKTVDITILGDTKFELDERFKLVLGNGTNAAVNTPVTWCKIVNDDEDFGKTRSVRH